MIAYTTYLKKGKDFIHTRTPFKVFSESFQSGLNLLSTFYTWAHLILTVIYKVATNIIFEYIFLVPHERGTYHGLQEEGIGLVRGSFSKGVTLKLSFKGFVRISQEKKHWRKRMCEHAYCLQETRHT